MDGDGISGAGAFPTQLTEAEFESARYDELDDMVSTTGVAFLGLSIGCARCHDHKFDPITSREYYQLAAVFSSVIRAEKSFDLDPEANRHARTQHENELREKRNKLQTMQKEIPQRLARWLEETRNRPEEPTTGKFGQARSSLKTNRSISCKRMKVTWRLEKPLTKTS